MSARASTLGRKATNGHLIMLAAASLLIGALIAALPVKAAAAAELAGSWSGSGNVTLSNGAREKARCRASFVPAGGRTFAMSATCATASAKVSQTAILSQNTANRYGGTFYNPEFGVTGRIRVIVNGNRQTVYLSGSAGHATFNLRRR
jgi:hypothetical protein